jgi:predicted neuraminidase
LIKRFLVIGLLGIGFFWAVASFGKPISPLVKSEFIFIQDLPNVPFSHAPTIAETSCGFVVAWFGGTCEKNPDTKIFISMIERNLKSWTIPTAVAEGSDEEGPVACWNPVLFQQKNGPLFLFYKTGKNPKSWKGMFKVSFDGGKTWSPSNYLPDSILGPTKNKPIELDDGTILCPSSTQSSDGWKVFIELIRPQSISDFLLKNKWSIIGPLNDRSMLVIQPTLLNFGGGKILLLSRNKQPNPFLPQSIMEARSTDNGLRWSQLKPSGLSNPNSGIDAVALKDGRCVLVCNPTHIKRTPLEVVMSMDQGKTWVRCLKLENGFGEYSYPSVIQASDGMIHIVYAWQRRKIKHVVIDPGLIRLEEGSRRYGIKK